MEEGDNRSISKAEEVGRTEETRGEGEEREGGGGGERNKGRGSRKTMKGEKPGGGDATIGVRESKGDEKERESSWKVTSAKVA